MWVNFGFKVVAALIIDFVYLVSLSYKELFLLVYIYSVFGLLG